MYLMQLLTVSISVSKAHSSSNSHSTDGDRHWQFVIGEDASNEANTKEGQNSGNEEDSTKYRKGKIVSETNINHIQVVESTTESGESLSSVQSSNSEDNLKQEPSSRRKAVQFKHDVKDNEAMHKRITYNRATATAAPTGHPNRADGKVMASPFIIGVGKLEKATGMEEEENLRKMQNASNQSPRQSPDRLSSSTSSPSPLFYRSSDCRSSGSYNSVFSSPYFDYRKTHSKVCTISININHL